MTPLAISRELRALLPILLTAKGLNSNCSHGRISYSWFLNSIPDPVFWKNRQSEFLGCNQAFAHAMGQLHPNQLVGLTDFDLPYLSDEDAAYYQVCDRMVMERGEADLNIN